MTTLELDWRYFRTRVIHPGLSEGVVALARVMFYAGAVSALGEVVKIEEHAEELSEGEYHELMQALLTEAHEKLRAANRQEAEAERQEH